jgi:hypothetical protein
MLEVLMAEIRGGGTLTSKGLAARLGTSVELVQMMLEKLVQMRLIQNFNETCHQGCGGCGFGDECGKTPPLTLFATVPSSTNGERMDEYGK